MNSIIQYVLGFALAAIALGALNHQIVEVGGVIAPAMRAAVAVVSVVLVKQIFKGIQKIRK